jgi:adenylate cyclase
VDAVFKYRGVLDKFIGDAIMALFGAPLPREEHALLACQSALEMRQRLELLNRSRVERGQAAIKIGIGISSGEVLCGNIGSEKRMEYTAIGDGVNLASRLEGANKLYGTDIMISEFTYHHVRDRVLVRELDHIRVKGKDQPVRVYELVALSGEELPTARRDLLSSYQEGIARYRERRFMDAVHSFERALSLQPGDLPSRTYYERCNFFVVSPPPDDWDGVWELKEK